MNKKWLSDREWSKRATGISLDDKIKAEALAAENAAVFNLAEIRKLELEVSRLQSMQLLLTTRLDRGEVAFHRRILALENALADARRDTALLTRLAVRMGRGILAHNLTRYPYTVIGQAEHDAAMHEAEGEPPKREDFGI